MRAGAGAQDKEYQRLRDAAVAIIREMGVECGGSNVQMGINPEDGDHIRSLRSLGASAGRDLVRTHLELHSTIGWVIAMLHGCGGGPSPAAATCHAGWWCLS